MTDGHVSHGEGEADPWHVRARAEESGDAISTSAADQKGEKAFPEVEEANEIEDRYGDAEEILLVGFGVGDALEKTGKWVG